MKIHYWLLICCSLLCLVPFEICTPHPIIETKLHQIIDQFDSGDLILFRIGCHSTTQSFLKYFFRTDLYGSPWGHVAMVYRDQMTHKLYLLEFRNTANTMFTDYLQRFSNKECQKIELKPFLEQYNYQHHAYFAVRKLSKPINNYLLDQLFHRCQDYRFRPWKDFAYIFMLPKSMHPKDIQNRKMHCTEFIADTLIKTGVFRGDKPSYMYAPKHFTSKYDAENVAHGYSYSEPVLFQV